MNLVSVLLLFSIVSNERFTQTLAFTINRGFQATSFVRNLSLLQESSSEEGASEISSSTQQPRPRRTTGGPRRGPPSSKRRERRSETTTAPRKRAPHQFDHTKEEARPFIDPLVEIRLAPSNEDGPVYDLEAAIERGELKPSSKLKQPATEEVKQHFETYSLDDLFPGFDLSEKFASNAEFRTELRNAMREDIFDTTPAYANMSDKARKMLLLPDSSLQGSWRCGKGPEKNWIRKDNDNNENDDNLRMLQLTSVLQKYLGSQAPTGDEFMEKIGSLCGSEPLTHWIDIVGVADRRIPHSWHQDTGRSRNGDTKTVTFGFPKEDNYDGVGVFSHVVKLAKEQWADEKEHPPNEPIVYQGKIPDEYIVRPRFVKGKEILVYRDVDTIHSPPDVTYRASVMRFM